MPHIKVNTLKKFDDYGRVDVPGTRSHREASKWSVTHRSVYTLVTFDTGYTTSISCTCVALQRYRALLVKQDMIIIII